MLSTDDRHTLRQLIIVRAAEESDNESLIEMLEDPDELQEWLRDKLQMNHVSAHSLAYAADDVIYEQDLETLSEALGFDIGLLKALISPTTSHEVLAHSIDQALESDLACEECLEFAALVRPARADEGGWHDLGLAVLGHVYVPETPLGDLVSDQLMSIWEDLDQPGRLRVLASAMEEQAFARSRQLTEDDFVHEWYYMHLTQPMRLAVKQIMEHHGAVGGRRLVEAVPDLAGDMPGDAEAETKRLARLFYASHARAVAATSRGQAQGTPFAPVVGLAPRGQGLVLAVPGFWKPALLELLEIDSAER